MPDSKYKRYQELQAYAGWGDSDARRIQAAANLVQPFLMRLVEDFYAEIDRHSETRQIIRGGTAQIERLKSSLLRWLQELFSGNYDAHYVDRRWSVGARHAEIGLNQVFANVALSRIRRGLMLLFEEHWTGTEQELRALRHSLNTLLDLDLAIIEDAYSTEYANRLQENERLAVLGQFSSGVAHELRNPLNVIKTSVYYILTAQNPQPDKVQSHLRRIERQVETADSVITTLSRFSKLPVTHGFPVDVNPFLQDLVVIEELPGLVTVEIVCPENLPQAIMDTNQMRIAFGNLIRNAQEAMPQGGRIQILAVPIQDKISISIVDSGPGIDPTHINRLTEPFFSTKPNGIGLGLSLTRAIVDRNRGRLIIENEPGSGARITIELPTVPR